MSSSSKNIYDEHIKLLSREEQRVLLDMLQTALENGDDNGQRHSILELHGLGREIWQGVDTAEYIGKLRDEWEERA